MNLFKAYQQAFEYALEDFYRDNPHNLYIPIQYLLDLGGKRIRPFLTLMAGEAYGLFLQETMGAAMAVEVFHNFTLMHDDIMDKAKLRRVRPQYTKNGMSIPPSYPVTLCWSKPINFWKLILTIYFNN